MTVMIISYLLTWANMIYALVNAPTDVEFWREEIKSWKNARLSGVFDISKIMKYPILLLIVCLYLPAWGQPVNRKSEIEMCMAQVYSSKEFQ